jgi:hypothetical protein
LWQRQQAHAARGVHGELVDLVRPQGLVDGFSLGHPHAHGGRQPGFGRDLVAYGLVVAVVMESLTKPSPVSGRHPAWAIAGIVVLAILCFGGLAIDIEVISAALK